MIYNFLRCIALTVCPTSMLLNLLEVVMGYDLWHLPGTYMYLLIS